MTCNGQLWPAFSKLIQWQCYLQVYTLLFFFLKLQKNDFSVKFYLKSTGFVVMEIYPIVVSDNIPLDVFTNCSMPIRIHDELQLQVAGNTFSDSQYICIFSYI